MNSRKRSVVALLDGIAILGSAGCGIFPYSYTKDYSDFEVFRLDQVEYLGLCVDLYTVYSATIRRESEERYVVQLNIVAEINYDVPDCPVDTRPDWDIEGNNCPTLVAMPERQLTSDEVGRMIELFGRARLRARAILDNLQCLFCVIDPCSVTIMEWDGEPGERDYLEGEYLGEVQQFLESLRAE